MTLNLELEFYPELNNNLFKKAVEIIQQNSSKWAKPFFIDVYNYSDIEKFKEICLPFLKKPNFRNIIILGTGGSIQTSLALCKLFDKKLYPIVSSRPEELREVLNNCKPEESVVLPISRGGKTLDVNSTLDLFKEYPMIGLSSQGPMFEYLKSRNIPILDVPDLSGRFAASVCSVGLVPALLGGIDIEYFLKKLDTAYKIFKDLSDVQNNIALQYATFLKVVYNNGYSNIFNMPYSSLLEGLVGLFVQELSESSGKDGKGLLGTSQPAPLCQHSVLELLLGGKKGHTSPLLWCLEEDFNEIKINNPFFGLNNLTANQIINYQADATFEALIKQEVASAKISIKKFNVENIACTIAFIQSAVYYFCMLLDVNWESNPLVVIGKQICNEAIQHGKTKEERINDRKKAILSKFESLKLDI
ncbi:MAG: hypothetical protein ACTSRZ_04955 [Promethearchaeota archaeon]